jgi:uncharacterized lipoprotein YmbA
MKILIKYFSIVSIVLSLVACSFGGKPSVMVEQYALEYPPPSVQSISPMDEVIRLERFSVAQVFNHVKMVYRQKPTQYNDYAYHADCGNLQIGIFLSGYGKYPLHFEGRRRRIL